MGTIEKTFELINLPNKKNGKEKNNELRFSDNFLNKDGIMCLKENLEKCKIINLPNPRFRTK